MVVLFTFSLNTLAAQFCGEGNKTHKLIQARQSDPKCASSFVFVEKHVQVLNNIE